MNRTPWEVPQSVRDAFVKSTVISRKNPLTRDIDKRFITDIRTQLPIHPRVYGLVHHCQNLPTSARFLGNMPRLVASTKQTASELWLPGKSRRMEPHMRLDAHQSGVAIDFMVSVFDPVSRIDRLAEYLGEHCQEIGLQRLVWCGMTLDGDYPCSDFRRVHSYTGNQFHGDHIHCEINPDAETDFYNPLHCNRGACR